MIVLQRYKRKGSSRYFSRSFVASSRLSITHLVKKKTGLRARTRKLGDKLIKMHTCMLAIVQLVLNTCPGSTNSLDKRCCNMHTECTRRAHPTFPDLLWFANIPSLHCHHTMTQVFMKAIRNWKCKLKKQFRAKQANMSRMRLCIQVSSMLLLVLRFEALSGTKLNKRQPIPTVPYLSEFFLCKYGLMDLY